MNPLALFTGSYGWLAKWGVIALLVLSFGAFCWLKGDMHGGQKLVDYKMEQLRETTRLQAARVEVVTQVETKYVDRIKTIEVKGDTITKEVPVYVTTADNAGCTINTGFVRTFNAGWTNTPAGPAAESDRGPADISLAAVAETDAFNAAACHVYKAQRDGLIEFYKKLQAVQ